MNKKQLWDSLLQQAISGKLVPQLDTEPAVEQIGPAPAHTEETFELPEKWKWVKMSDISASIRYGYTASANTSGNVKLLRVTDLQDSQVNWNTVPCCEIDSEYLPRFKLEKYDIVIARSGSVGKSFVVDHLDTSKSCVFASYLIRIRLNSEAQVNISFIKYYLNSPFYWQSISLSSRGTTLKNVNAQQLGGLLVPLPPLEEQRRIVAKLDELKPLVDQFGETHDKLSELEADFPRKLKASILQAAMQGKLVPQLDSEPSVEQIGPAPDDEPFALPEKWKWVNLKALSTHIQYGYTASASALGEAKLLRITDIQNGKVNWDSVPFCSISASDISKFSVIPDDIVIARSGGTVGKSFKVGQVKQHAVFASYLIRVRLKGTAIN